jgi:hypothetical protein
MEKLLAQLDELMNSNVDGDFEAFILDGKLQELRSGRPPVRAQHELFADICRDSLSELEKYQSGKLTDSPAAEPLLRFLTQSFNLYLSLSDQSKLTPSPADRNGILAKAFGLTRTDGRRVTITEEDRMNICAAYSGKLYELTGGRQPTELEDQEAQREALKVHHGKNWFDAGKAAQDTIRTILRANGLRPMGGKINQAPT